MNMFMNTHTWHGHKVILSSTTQRHQSGTASHRVWLAGSVDTPLREGSTWRKTFPLNQNSMRPPPRMHHCTATAAVYSHDWRLWRVRGDSARCFESRTGFKSVWGTGRQDCFADMICVKYVLVIIHNVPRATIPPPVVLTPPLRDPAIGFRTESSSHTT